jgi:hypothetical protein
VRLSVCGDSAPRSLVNCNVGVRQGDSFRGARIGQEALAPRRRIARKLAVRLVGVCGRPAETCGPGCHGQKGQRFEESAAGLTGFPAWLRAGWRIERGE